MRTVVGSVTGIDEDLRFDGSAEPRRVGRLTGDQLVRYLMSLPREFPPLEPGQAPPSLELVGREGMWLRLVRREPGEILRLSMKDGEEDHRVVEMQAVERVRLFVRHWGEDTELTGEIRLSHDERERLLAEERVKDELRAERLAKAPQRAAFSRRASRLVPFARYEIVVDREAGAVFERGLGRLREVLSLDGVREADVTGFESGDPEGRHYRVVARYSAEREAREVGRGAWPMRTAIRIAESVNDAIDLSESRRKFLRYRREGAEEGGAS